MVPIILACVRFVCCTYDSNSLFVSIILLHDFVFVVADSGNGGGGCGDRY